jgi:dTDP-4-amino-4,6-dideoxygalactose transaminase
MTEQEVRFWDPAAAFHAIEPEMMGTIHSVLAGGDLMMRHQLEDFETHLAGFTGTAHAVGVSNCTDGLQLILEAAGIGAGDEVITVSHTFIATLSAIHRAGATPVLVDVGDDHNLDVELLEPAITNRTRAIVPVHLNGRLCPMDRLMNIAQRHSLLVIEDTAQALGAAYDGVRGGAWGLAGAFSFYPAKLLGAYGDAGAVVTNDDELANKVRALRDPGRVSKSEVIGWGHNCRLDNMQAAVLDVKLRHVPEWIAYRRRMASVYDEALAGITEIKRPPAPEDGRFFDIYQNYVIEAEQRDSLQEHLASQGVETLIHWPVPNHHQPIGLSRYQLPRTEALSRKVISLPLHTDMTEEQALFVAEAVRGFFR